jgi:ribosomal protein S18 acetylase RimI-like enzyme
MQLTIRAGTRDDREFVANLGKRTVMDSVTRLRHPEPGAVLRNFDRLLTIVDRHEHVTLIAESDGERVGFLLLLLTLPDEVTGEDQSFIAYMAVDRDLRGRGIGAALLAAAEDEARTRGAPYMALMVTEENAPARALYERAGYLTERRLLCKML